MEGFVGNFISTGMICVAAVLPCNESRTCFSPSKDIKILLGAWHPQHDQNYWKKLRASVANYGKLLLKTSRCSCFSQRLGHFVTSGVFPGFRDWKCPSCSTYPGRPWISLSKKRKNEATKLETNLVLQRFRMM